MEWAFIWLMLVLKIPIAMLLYIVWWAIRATPEPVADEGDGGLRRPHERPRSGPPKPPRRGPGHASPTPPAPPRVRTPVVAREPARPHR